VPGKSGVNKRKGARGEGRGARRIRPDGEELNTLYPVNLDTDIICDRFMEDDVFDEKTMDRTDLVLFGASHLPNIAKHLNNEK
jgi:hypothetical protein